MKYRFERPPLIAEVDFSYSASTRPGSIFGELVIRVSADDLTLLRDRKQINAQSEPHVADQAERWAEACMKRALSLPPQFGEN